jgi:hypothetical protein
MKINSLFNLYNKYSLQYIINIRIICISSPVFKICIVMETSNRKYSHIETSNQA